MANTMTNVMPIIFAQGLVALREASIMPRLINTDFGREVAEEGQVINVTIPSTFTVGSVTPAETPPAGQNVAPTKVPITLDQWKYVDFHLTDKELGEIIRGTRNQQVTEAVRALANNVDVYIHNLYVGIYGHTGTVGTTPFGTANDVSDATNVRKKLNQQLAPSSQRRVVLDPSAAANALTQRAFQDASWRGDPEGIRAGIIGEKFGMDWYESQNVVSHVHGTLSNGSGHLAKVNDASVDVGQTTTAMDETTLTGTVKIGDVFTVAGDTQQYVVTANATASGNAISVAHYPGAKVAWADDAVVTFVGAAGATEVVNLGFERNAFALAVRPLQTEGGFTGGNMIMSQADEVSGLTLRLEISREFKRTKYTFDILYGASLVDPRRAVRLAG